MTARQLFVAAFFGGATDAVPVYEQSFASDVASKILGREAFTGSTLLHYQEALWATKGAAAYEEFRQRVQRDVADLARTLGFGTISAPWLIGPPTMQVAEYDFLYGDPDGHWVIRRFDPRAMTFGVVKTSRPRAWTGAEEIRAAVESLQRTAEAWSAAAGPAAHFEAHTRKWLQVAGDSFELLARGAGLAVPMDEKWLTACALVPDLVAAYLDAQLEIGRRQLEIQARLGLRIVWAGGDLADNNGPVYGPRFFHDVVLPRYTALIAHAHSLGMKYLFRSDGNIWPIADDLFVTASADGYGEIDYDAGMRIPELQERYPSLTCWGNVSCRLLRTGTPAQVRAAAEEIVAGSAARGRLILGSSNTVLPGTPPDNYFAILEAAGRL